eukprot:GHVS01013223.1.p1 GENE.GHVS01013223.1~~GHVS01013223.1.p1  ORF type:complete len:655 (-),score=182.02 GHVS01013223.1:1335-3299(-)
MGGGEKFFRRLPRERPSLFPAGGGALSARRVVVASPPSCCAVLQGCCCAIPSSSFTVFPLLVLCLPLGYVCFDCSSHISSIPSTTPHSSFSPHSSSSTTTRPSPSSSSSFFSLFSLIFWPVAHAAAAADSSASSHYTSCTLPPRRLSVTSAGQRRDCSSSATGSRTSSSTHSLSYRPIPIAPPLLSSFSSGASNTSSSRILSSSHSPNSVFFLEAFRRRLIPPHFSQSSFSTYPSMYSCLFFLPLSTSSSSSSSSSTSSSTAAAAAWSASSSSNQAPPLSPPLPSSSAPPQASTPPSSPVTRYARRSLHSSSSALLPIPSGRSAVGLAAAAANAPSEDRLSAVPIRASSQDDYLLASVIDGHGGWHVAEFVRTRLPQHVEEELSKSEDFPAVLKAAFLSVDNQIRDSVRGALKLGYMQPVTTGACALTLLVTPEQLVVANAGDSKGVLSRRGKASDINVQQNANNPDEQQRLREEHPNENVVTCAREHVEYKKSPLKGRQRVVTYEACYVKDLLSPTRSFGDFYLKEEEFQMQPASNTSMVQQPHSFPYITSDPQIHLYLRTKEDEFVVLASDGIWDIYDSQQVVDIVRAKLKEAKDSSAPAEDAAAGLVQSAKQTVADRLHVSLSRLEAIPEGAYRRQLHDDMSVIVIVLNGL